MTRRPALGWIQDAPDERDHFHLPLAALQPALPRRVDLRVRGPCPAVLDQGPFNTCTAHAVANAHLFDQLAQGLPAPELPSRLFIYWNDRVALGLTDRDSGATLRGSLRSLAKIGACPESLWPYEDERLLRAPDEDCFSAATPHRALSYRRVHRDAFHLRSCLAEGFPFVFGFTTFEEFHSDAVRASGALPMPRRGEQPVGGHAVLAVGYDLADGTVLVMNSYGPQWGRDGCFTMPLEYLLHERLAADFWTLRSVAG